jgi:hypothetical protein
MVKVLARESNLMEKGLLSTTANNKSICATFGNGDPDDIRDSSALDLAEAPRLSILRVTIEHSWAKHSRV